MSWCERQLHGHLELEEMCETLKYFPEFSVCVIFAGLCRFIAFTYAHKVHPYGIKNHWLKEDFCFIFFFFKENKPGFCVQQ